MPPRGWLLRRKGKGLLMMRVKGPLVSRLAGTGRLVSRGVKKGLLVSRRVGKVLLVSRGVKKGLRVSRRAGKGNEFRCDDVCPRDVCPI